MKRELGNYSLIDYLTDNIDNIDNEIAKVI